MGVRVGGGGGAESGRDLLLLNYLTYFNGT